MNTKKSRSNIGTLREFKQANFFVFIFYSELFIRDADTSRENQNKENTEQKDKSHFFSNYIIKISPYHNQIQNDYYR